MGLFGFFGNNFQDDSKRPLVNKWLESLEPPDAQSLLELEHDFDLDDQTSSNTTPQEDNSPGMSSPIYRHYDWSQVQVSTWQDPFSTYDTPQYESSWQDARSKSYADHGYQRVLSYQVLDEPSSDEEDEEDEVGK